MIRRHPHVFADADATAPEDVDKIWARIKAEERAEKKAERAKFTSALDGPAVSAASLLADVPTAMPAMTRAIKLQDKAAKVGFDWPNLAPVFDKLKEEIAEFEEVALPVDPRGEPSIATSNAAAAISEEFGDMLFVMANVARHLKIDPETCLRGANAKFSRRFAHIEARLADQGRKPAQSSLAEMDALWDEAKLLEKR